MATVIRCHSCGARYRLHQEQLKHAVSQTRCRRCGATLILRRRSSSGSSRPSRAEQLGPPQAPSTQPPSPPTRPSTHTPIPAPTAPAAGAAQAPPGFEVATTVDLRGPAPARPLSETGAFRALSTVDTLDPVASQSSDTFPTQSQEGPLKVTLAPGDRVEKYEVVELLGSGGMAQVYKVRHTVLNSLHALKVLDPKLVAEPEARRRFLEEGRIQARLLHPHIVPITDVVAQPGIAGLIAEYIEGPDLEQYQAELSLPPTPEHAVELFGGVLEGLGYAHQHGVVHRDIKPGNILLAPRPRGGRTPRIADFGIARLMGQRQTRTGAWLGTVAYMAPEQIQGAHDVDARADIFSVAVSLFQFLVFRLPYEGRTDYDTMKLIVESGPPPAAAFGGHLPAPLIAAVQRALATRREDRFASCQEFADALRAALQQDPAPSASHPAASDAPTSLALELAAVLGELTRRPAIEIERSSSLLSDLNLTLFDVMGLGSSIREHFRVDLPMDGLQRALLGPPRNATDADELVAILTREFAPLLDHHPWQGRAPFAPQPFASSLADALSVELLLQYIGRHQP